MRVAEAMPPKLPPDWPAEPLEPPRPGSEDDAPCVPIDEPLQPPPLEPPPPAPQPP